MLILVYQYIYSGKNIGIRLIDEFLSKTNINNCSNYRETADVIAKVAFKFFLGITCEVANWNAENDAFSLILPSNIPSNTNDSFNPLTEYVEIPPQYLNRLHYSNILCGVIEGALECLQINVECQFVKDVLNGDDCTELRVCIKGAIETVMSEEYQEN